MIDSPVVKAAIQAYLHDPVFHARVHLATQLTLADHPSRLTQPPTEDVYDLVIRAAAIALIVANADPMTGELGGSDEGGPR